MIKKIAVVCALAAIVISVVTTILQIPPASFFINLLTGEDSKFPLVLTTLLTALVFLLPLLFVVILIEKLKPGHRNFMPDLRGKTGIVIKRKRQLHNAPYTLYVMINGEEKSGISNGKSTFVELLPGSYKIFIKGQTNVSAVHDIEIIPNCIHYFSVNYQTDGFKSKLQFEQN